jgi:hypothetical protein
MNIVLGPLDPNAVNPTVPAWQAPTVNVRTGNVEPPNPPLPTATAGVDPRTGNMLRAENVQPHGAEPVFPSPPSTVTNRGVPVSPI